MSNGLKLARDLVVPLDIVTEKLAHLGTTGSGKTYGATKLAELMLEAGAQIVAIDPVGTWYGLRIGFKSNLHIFGGLHGDVPLEPTSGALIADLLVDRRISAVLDVSQFETDADLHRWAIDFGRRFFFRKKASRSAVHIFVEECQELFPQNPMGRENNVLHEWLRIWKIGRNFGIGGSLISQRPQEVNKKALNLAGTLFAYRMTGPQERKTIEGWTKDKGIDEDINAILPKLKTGEPRIWSPSRGISKQFKILPKDSADISKTPTVGHDDLAEKPLTPIDIEQLKKAIGATIERAKDNDPVELKKKIAALESSYATVHAIHPKPKIVKDTKALKELQKRHAALEVEMKKLLTAFQGSLAKMGERILASLEEEPDLRHPAAITADVISRQIKEAEKSNGQRVVRVRHDAGANRLRHGEPLQRGEGKILAAVIQHGLVSRMQLRVLTGYSKSSVDTYLFRLQQAGYIEIGPDRRIAPTSYGNLASTAEPLPTGRELQEYWLGELSGGEKRILAVAIEQFPSPISRAEIQHVTEYSKSSVDTYLFKLRAKGVIETPAAGQVVASETLF